MIDQATAAQISHAMARGRTDVLDALIGLFSGLPSVMDVTLLAVLADEGMVRRIATSNEKMFPRGGGEALNRADPWCRRIMDDRQPVLANDSAGLAHYLTEAADIEAAGYGASGSFPIVIGGRVAGTINLLAPAGHFTDAVTAQVDALLPFAALAFLYPHEEAV